jgi:hypothetical protein
MKMPQLFGTFVIVQWKNTDAARLILTLCLESSLISRVVAHEDNINAGFLKVSFNLLKIPRKIAAGSDPIDDFHSAFLLGSAL